MIGDQVLSYLRNGKLYSSLTLAYRNSPESAISKDLCTVSSVRNPPLVRSTYRR